MLAPLENVTDINNVKIPSSAFSLFSLPFE
jgi:hypothetical protein